MTYFELCKPQGIEQKITSLEYSQARIRKAGNDRPAFRV